MATNRADLVEKTQKQHRRNKLAEYQRHYRLKHKLPATSESVPEDEENDSEENDPEVTIRVTLRKSQIDMLDKIGQAELKTLGGFVTTSCMRSYAIRSLISSREMSVGQQALKAVDRSMAAAKQFIIKQREEGISDADIERDLVKLGLGISSIAQVESYEYQSNEVKKCHAAHLAQQGKPESQE